VTPSVEECCIEYAHRCSKSFSKKGSDRMR
jgi:hypothetical protein